MPYPGTYPGTYPEADVAQQTIVLLTGTTWDVPDDCDTIDELHLWGGNASGAAPHGTAGNVGGGGGAGAYGRWDTISVTPGGSCTMSIGAGGTAVTGSYGHDGTATTFTVGATTYTAAGGAHGAIPGAGAGGAAPTTPTPAAAYKGGDGHAGDTVGDVPGGGGGSPGTTSAGGNSPGNAGGSGGTGSPAGTAGGQGGTSAAGDYSGHDGLEPDGTGTPGSAGGGGYFNGSVSEYSGKGGAGQILIKYTSATVPGETRVAELVGFTVAKGDFQAANAIYGPSGTHRVFGQQGSKSAWFPITWNADGTPDSVVYNICYRTGPAGSGMPTQAQMETWLNTVPAGRQIIVTFQPEPEIPGRYATGADFVTQFKSQSDRMRLAAVATGTDDRVRIATDSGSYQYGKSAAGVIRNAEAYAGNYLTGLGSSSPATGLPYADIFGIDVYQGQSWPAGFDWPTQGLRNYVQFQRWLTLITDTSIVGVRHPLGIFEYGVSDPTSDTARHDRIAADRDYLREAFTPGGPGARSQFHLATWMYWLQSVDANACYFSDAATIDLWKSIETASMSGPSAVDMAVDTDWQWSVTAAASTGGIQPPDEPPPGPAPVLLATGRRDWHFITGPAGGGYADELGQATGQTVTWRLTDAHDAQVTVNAKAGYDAGITLLETDLHVIRAGTPLFRGRIFGSQDDIITGAHSAAFAAISYRGILDRRVLYESNDRQWTDTDPGAIAWALVTETQTNPGGDLGIIPGQGIPLGGRLIDKVCEADDLVGEKIDDLAYVSTSDPLAGNLDGFDWAITPRDAYSLTLDLWPLSRGTYRGVWLQYGDALTGPNWSRSASADGFANALRMTGGGTTPPNPVHLEAPGIASDPAGRWDAVYQTEESNADLLAARAALQLQAAQQIIPSWTIPLRPGAWDGPAHIWLGDTIRIRASSGRLVQVEELRVLELTATLTADGEQVTVTAGAPRPDLRRKFRQLARELAKARKHRTSGRAARK